MTSGSLISRSASANRASICSTSCSIMTRASVGAVLAIVLALGTSVAYGSSNFLGPLLGRRHTVSAVLLVGQAAALAGAVALVLASGESAPPLHGILFGLLAGAGNVLGLATFYKAATLTSVSVVSAVGATAGTALPVLFGLATGEQLTALQAPGIVVAMAGGVLAAQSSRGAVVTRPGVLWALLSALGFGTLLIALPEAAEDGTAWALLDARIAVVVLLVAGDPRPAPAHARAGPLAAPARRPGLLLLAGTLSYAEATMSGQLSVVAVLASLATVVTALSASSSRGAAVAAAAGAGIALASAGVVLAGDLGTCWRARRRSSGGWRGAVGGGDAVHGLHVERQGGEPTSRGRP
jgi:drug/metabolite transporter (DMT)-like permease